MCQVQAKHRIAWFDGRRRDPMPVRLTVVRDASHFQPFSWVRLDATDPIAAFSDDLVDKNDEKMARREYAKLDRRYTQQLKHCRKGDRIACGVASETWAEMQLLLPPGTGGVQSR